MRWRPRPNVGPGKQFNKVFAGKIAGRPDTGGHVQVTLDRKLYYAHRIIWKMHHGTDPVGQIDHRSCVRADNRIGVLRDATHAENMHNRLRQRNNTSGYKGVSWHRKAKKWQAMIAVNGRNRRLGLYHDPASAHEAYLSAAERLRGDFARSV